jgi:integrase
MKAKLTNTLLKSLEPQPSSYKVWDTTQQGFYVRVSPKGLKTYVLRYITPEDKDQTYTLGRYGQITLDKARDLARLKMGSVASGVDIQAQKKAVRVAAQLERASTLGGFIELHYADYLKAERRTGDELLASLKANFGSYFDKQLVDINVGLITRWRTDRINKGIAPASVNRDISTLKAALNRAVEWGILETNPIQKLKPLRLDKSKRVRFLSDEEESRLRTALKERNTEKIRDRANANAWRETRGYDLLPPIPDGAFADHLMPIVLLALNTGMRRGELLNLTWNDVDLRRKLLTIEGATSKTGQTRHIPLNKEAHNVLKQWKAQGARTNLVFPSPVTGKPMDNIKSAWRELTVDADIQDFRFHDCRHHFASQLVMRGVDLNTVRELLGHASIDMTLRYAHLAEEHKTAAVALLDK